MTKRQAARPLIPGSVLSRMKKLFSQKLQTNYGAQPAFYPVGNWLLPGTNSRSVESTSYCNMMPRLRTGGGVPTWCRAELNREGTLLSRIEGKNCDWKVRKAEKNEETINMYNHQSNNRCEPHRCWSVHPLLGRPVTVYSYTNLDMSVSFILNKRCVYLRL